MTIAMTIVAKMQHCSKNVSLQQKKTNLMTKYNSTPNIIKQFQKTKKLEYFEGDPKNSF